MGVNWGCELGLHRSNRRIEEEEEEYPLLKEMMEGLAGGFESEESEEE